MVDHVRDIAGYWCVCGALCVGSPVRDHLRMKWTTAVGHVRRLAEQCAEMSLLPPDTRSLHVTELWVFGDLLGAPRELDWGSAAVCVDLPTREIPWMCRPDGATSWAEATRASKNPVGIWWRSSRSPVWNHRIVRPLLVWDVADGIHEENLAAIREGRGGAVAVAAPSEGEYVTRLNQELQNSLAELQRRTQEYEVEHTTRLGVRGDRLHAAAAGFLDVWAAVHPEEVGDDG